MPKSKKSGKAFSGLSILVVDDKAFIRELIVKLLEPIGFKVRTAENGKNAIAIWQDWQPDLILMDIRMPVMDGYTAIEQIKSNRSSRTKIVAFTASALEEERSVILATGCDDFLRKPFEMEELLSLMQNHLGVSYVYANSIDEQKPSTASFLELNNDSFLAISDDLLAQLYKSIMAIDLDKIGEVVNQISQENKLLAQAINQHIDNFEYERILQF